MCVWVHMSMLQCHQCTEHVFTWYIPISCMVRTCAYLGHWSLGVTFPARLNSGTSVGSPGLLLLWATRSRTCCSMTAGSVSSGGMGFLISSGKGSSASSSSSGCSSAVCFFFFFLALCWVRGDLASKWSPGLSFRTVVLIQGELGTLTPSCLHQPLALVFSPSGDRHRTPPTIRLLKWGNICRAFAGPSI